MEDHIIYLRYSLDLDRRFAITLQGIMVPHIGFTDMNYIHRYKSDILGILKVCKKLGGILKPVGIAQQDLPIVYLTCRNGNIEDFCQLAFPQL